ncbi:MAG: hypothetical protein H7A49_04205 [Akkermansiaceae bacterium]|nr:hypothetical protein [Akkermansiaceae bacterium]
MRTLQIIGCFVVLLMGANGDVLPRTMTAQIEGWVLEFSYTDPDTLGPDAKPKTLVMLSRPGFRNRAEMEAPFSAFFTLWDHLNWLAPGEASDEPLKLISGRNGVILREGDRWFKAIYSKEATMLLRLWLDLYRFNWNVLRDGFDKDVSGALDGFGYCLRNSPFPWVPKGLLMPQNRTEQASARQPATNSESNSEGRDKLQTESEGRSR